MCLFDVLQKSIVLLPSVTRIMFSAGLHLRKALYQRVEPVVVWLEAALSFIYPAVCQICKKARAGPAEAFVCAACRDEIDFIQPPMCRRCGFPFQGAITTSFECASCRELQPAFSSARSATVAKDSMLAIIHRYKYQHGLWFEPFLAELLISRAAPELAKADWDWIVPVPLYPAKQREREFNQAERLARRLSRV